MDYSLNEEQEMLKTAARDFLVKECPVSLVRDMEQDEKRYSEDLWHKTAALGWAGLLFPEEYGGSGGSFQDLAVLLEEMGRALMPGPFLHTVILCGMAIMEAGTEEQKRQFLPGIARGDSVMSLAITESSASYRPEDIAVRAIPDKDAYIISGIKLFVPYAHIADYLICAARTGKDGKDGITLFLVDRSSAGLTCTLLDSMAADGQCEVGFDKVRVPKENILGKLDDGWGLVETSLKVGAIAECTLMLGASDRMMELTLDFVKERVAYGSPIGRFQVVQHQCVDMAIDVEAARHITHQAVWAFSQKLPCVMEVSMAKALVSESCDRVCRQGCHLHGALGFTEMHDTQLYFRRVKAAAFTFGDTAYHQQIVARQLGL